MKTLTIEIGGMRPTLLARPGNEAIGEKLAALPGTEYGCPEMHHFPGGEAYVRLPADVMARDVVLICSLYQPDAKYLPLIFVAETAKDLKAHSVGLICPYLAYMRPAHPALWLWVSMAGSPVGPMTHCLLRAPGKSRPAIRLRIPATPLMLRR